MSDAPVKTGDVLAGKFRVDRVVGEGGMGVVVEATHLALDQRVALKFLNERGRNDAAAVARFEREARAAARLKSKHAVRIMDVGVMGDGQPYMVMELLEGEDLASVIKAKGRLSVDEAVDTMMQACDAVAEAHKRGIVHRDLKPGNLFVTHDNNGAVLVKVLDFGISKVQGESMALTDTTQILGSPLYMSPEQLRASKEVDPRADVWALGVILYEMLTGHVPFNADTMIELIFKVVESPPEPISRFRDDVPPHILAAVDACLAKDREDRVPSVVDLMQRLVPGTAAASLAPRSSTPTPVVDAPSQPLDDSREAKVDPPAASAISQPTAPNPMGSTTGGTSHTTPRTARTPVALFAGVAIALVALAGLGWRFGAASSSSQSNGASPVVTQPAAPSTTPAPLPPIESAPTAAAATPGSAPAASASAASASASAATSSAALTGPKRPTAAAPPTAAPPPPSATAKPSCNPPYTFTPQGAKQWKPECL